MIFEILWDAAKKGELLLHSNGMCHFHLRQDGQVTIREIIVLPECQRTGIGRSLLYNLKLTKGATSIFAKCPADLESNGWYKRMGFTLEGIETTKTGREVNLWRLWVLQS